MVIEPTRWFVPKTENRTFARALKATLVAQPARGLRVALVRLQEKLQRRYRWTV